MFDAGEHLGTFYDILGAISQTIAIDVLNGGRFIVVLDALTRRRPRSPL